MGEKSSKNIDNKNENLIGEKKESVNIFDEFSTDASLEEEKILRKTKVKDIYHYLKLFGKIFQVLFFLLFLIVLFVCVYIYVQKDEKVSTGAFLNPICGIFLGDVPMPEVDCSSISYTNKNYSENLKELEKDLSKEIIGILPIVYESVNFLKTKEISFLIDKTEDRMDIIKVLEKFNNLKNDFTGVEKKKLLCKNFKIDIKQKIFSVNCKAYSKGYESDIIGFSGEKNSGEVKGTSISVANSFLNYIEKKSTYFSILEKTKVFSGNNLISESGYTTETSFAFKLKINN